VGGRMVACLGGVFGARGGGGGNRGGAPPGGNGGRPSKTASRKRPPLTLRALSAPPAGTYEIARAPTCNSYVDRPGKRFEVIAGDSTAMRPPSMMYST